MAAGYNSLTVTRTNTGVSWSFNATAQNTVNYYCRVYVGDDYAEAREGAVASLPVTGSAEFGTEEYLAKRKEYTVTQMSRPYWQIGWATDDYITVTVTWDTAMLWVAVNGIVTACANIKVKSGSDVKDVIGVYSVKNGEVKPGI